LIAKNLRLIGKSCDALGLKRTTYYRLCRPATEKLPTARTRPRRALTKEEREEVIVVLHEERFMDKAPAEIYAALLDEGRYLCSIRTMYRILASLQEVRERRNQLRHPQYKKPELLAIAPNQVWSWDITKLKGPAKWNYYYLYVILDIFSRYAVGWMVATRETAALAKELIAETCTRQGIDRSQLIIHSDRGSPMKSKAVALLLSDLGVGTSFNRPYVSNDNPYSEAHFKTLKDRPLFPERFGSIQDARELCRQFFDWYNNLHYHGGIALMTPATVHYGKAEDCSQSRQKVLNTAHIAHPERFVRGQPKTIALPLAVWINKPNPVDEPLLLNSPLALDCEPELLIKRKAR
jgi:putative transposase